METAAMVVIRRTGNLPTIGGRAMPGSNGRAARTIAVEMAGNKEETVSDGEIPTATEMEEDSRVATTTESNSSLLLPRRMANRVCAAVTALLLLAACSADGAFDSDFKAVDSSGWERSRPFVFELPDTLIGSACFDISLCVRHDNSYEYGNLWVIADFVAAGKVVESDTVNIKMCDTYGNWIGSGLGKLFQQSVPLKSGVRAGRYDRVMLWHCMRDDNVGHLEDIGLIYSKTDDN